MFSPLDKTILQFDKALRTIIPSVAKSQRPSPAGNLPDTPLSAHEQQHASGLMRINHTGEVCAQALYAGQATTAKLASIRAEMEHAAAEEVDHLVWCETRLTELNSRPSIFNPLFYTASFVIGAGAGLISDKLSLGFVAATEDQVCVHLDKHLAALPPQDARSRAILSQMRLDEAKHKQMALDSGGYEFPTPIMSLMTRISKIMTLTTYRI